MMDTRPSRKPDLITLHLDLVRQAWCRASQLKYSRRRGQFKVGVLVDVCAD